MGWRRHFVAHNASFDMGFIDTGYERLGFGPSTNGVIDTLELSRTINTEYGKHGLNFLAKSMASNSHNTIEPFMIQRLRPTFSLKWFNK